MNKTLKIIIIDDSERDSLLILRTLGKRGLEPLFRRVDTAEGLQQAIAEESWDIIVSDCYMPVLSAETALRMCREKVPDVPFIIVSGAIGEEEAVAFLKAGAQDFIRKDNLSRLVPAIERALDEAEGRRQRQRAEETLRMFSFAVEQGPAGVVIADIDGTITYANKKLVELSGYGMEELIGKNLQMLKSDCTATTQYRKLWETVRAGNEWHGEFRTRRKNGDYYWESTSISPIKSTDGTITHIIGISEDITRRKEIEEQTWRQANYDNLTELANRNLFMDRLKQVLAKAARAGNKLALMYLDLDRFKYVNDTLGHDAGDQLLRQAAQRLSSCVRESDMVSRLGGDEFTVILPDITTEHLVVVVTERILEALSRSFTLGKREVYVGASVGITLYPDDAANPHDLLRNADTAMYQAKEAGRNTYRFFTRAMNRHAEARMTLENALRRAVRGRQFAIAYQPILELSSGNVVCAEALLRWQQPGGRLVPPHEFISVAEEIGLIVSIGEWVLSSACTQMKKWVSTGSAPLHVSVKFSSAQCKAPALKALVTRILNMAKLPAERLTLEFTERLLIQDTEEMAGALRELKDMGVRISIDDFGTGYSSLSYLKRFPADSLKIERSFVRDISTDPGDRALCKAIIAMAHALGLTVIAEGVETAEQLSFLEANQCDMAQGFYFSEPLEPDRFETFLGKANLPARSLKTEGQRD